MTNKTYTLKDGTVLKVGDVYEATPEGYLRMVTHHVEMFGVQPAPKHWFRDNDNDEEFQPPSILAGLEYAPFTIIWLPKQTDDNVIPPDEVVAYARHVQHVWFISPADNILSYIKGPINTNEMMKLEWLISKGVTFYKTKPEGV